MFIGLQAAGKSSFYALRFARTHTLVSKDLLRNNRHPERRQLALVREALERGESVVVDNTNPRREDRAALIALARDYNAHISAFYFPPDVRGSLARDRQRTGHNRVPDVAIFATRKKLVPPSSDEGFERIYQVRLLDGGVFAVSDAVGSA